MTLAVAGASNFVGGNTSGGGGGGGGGGSSVVPNPSWSQATWYVDPQNSSGLASDANTGIDATHPVLTWNGGVIAKLQTFKPRLGQDTAIFFMSSHVDNSDPVYFSPYSENGALPSIQGVLGAPVETGTLASVVAATDNALLQVTLGASAAVGMLIVNTSRANSVSILYQKPSGTTFNLFQPLPANSVGTFLTTPNNAWATGDSYAVYSLVAVNLVEFKPTFVDVSTSTQPHPGGNIGTLFQITVLDPGLYFGFYGNSCYLGVVTSQYNCVFQRLCITDATPSFFTGNSINSWYAGGVGGGPAVAWGPGATTPRRFYGGGLGGPKAFLTMQLYGADLEAKCVVGSSVFHAANMGGGILTSCYVDTGVTIAIDGICTCAKVAGTGNVNVIGTAKITYSGTATACFTTTGVLKINGSTTASSASVSGGVATINTGIALTPANLDAAAGPAGFGGSAFNLPGASISNIGV